MGKASADVLFLLSKLNISKDNTDATILRRDIYIQNATESCFYYASNTQDLKKNSFERFENRIQEN